MTKYDAEWVRAEEEKRTFMAENGLYSEEEEHSSCGVGLVVSIDGKPTRSVVENGIAALKAIWHRGAVDADGKTGDGAGIHVQIPVPFFYDQIERTGHKPNKDQMIAVGQVFLPRTNFAAQETCRTIVETEVLRMGYYIYGWRHVPVAVECLGEKANATRPEIEQILISNSKGVDEDTFERELYVIRRRIEKAATAAGIGELYIASLSCRSIIYKGMMLAEQVAEFYPDLMDERFESAFAIYHQRYSTNTFPQWWLAQPFRMLAHNGEINTLKGNVNWMKSHEIRMASDVFGDMAEDIKPIVASGSSDSAALDSVFEVLVRAGRNAPMAKTMLVPESWSKQAIELPQAWRDMYSYCNSVMEPWDGPAALAMTDGRWVCAGLDRNGLRPMRYVVTNDGLVIAGSETGMVPLDEARVKEKGALGPGQLLAVDMKQGKLYHDKEIKDEMAAARPFGEWVGKIKDLDAEVSQVEEKPLFTGEELRRRQIAAGYTIEELEQILVPMAEDGKETLASMGDDTPSAVLSNMYRPLSHFFRQNFSQVTNPPIDSLREFRVM
ncbi:MAG: glutamate synthase large subunit, partial [Rhodobacteraceae bacterium]|nr:glutamate synthase large subunit [Paracoccaceae bacterium]